MTKPRSVRAATTGVAYGVPDRRPTWRTTELGLPALPAERIDVYDPRTGRLLWHADAPRQSPIPSAVFHDGTIYMTRGYRNSPYLALRPDGRMVVVFAQKSPEAWETLVDALCMGLVQRPEEFDVLDVAAAVVLRQRDRVAAIAPDVALVDVVVVGDRAPAHQRRNDRDAGHFGKRHQQLGGVGIDDAAAGHDQRAT